MTLEQFTAFYDGKYVEVAGSPNAKNQCVDLANAYLRDVLNHPIVEWTHAKDFPSKLPNFEWIPNTTEAIPNPGDIIIWQHDQYGHIAICVSATQTSFVSFDQNYPLNTPAHFQKHSYLRPKVAGWLRKKGTMSAKIYTEEQMTAVRLERDRNWDSFKAEQKAHSLLKAEVEKMNNEHEDMIVSLSTELATKDKTIAGLRGEITKKETEITQLNASLGEASKPKSIFLGKRKMLVALLTPLIAVGAKILNDHYGFALDQEAVLALVLSGVAYITAEGGKDILEVIRETSSKKTGTSVE